jgi:hypothetical protein
MKLSAGVNFVKVEKILGRCARKKREIIPSILAARRLKVSAPKTSVTAYGTSQAVVKPGTWSRASERIVSGWVQCRMVLALVRSRAPKNVVSAGTDMERKR